MQDSLLDLSRYTPGSIINNVPCSKLAFHQSITFSFAHISESAVLDKQVIHKFIYRRKKDLLNILVSSHFILQVTIFLDNAY